MPRKQPQLAKLTRPRIHRAVARERLFKLIDEKRQQPAVWIAGPPGAGKTTLVASYLEEAGTPAIWYQIDAGDSDPATFFYYLKLAVENIVRGEGHPLPLLTPENLSDLEGFSRRFFRQAFSLLPEGCVLAFDNYHEIAPDSELHTAFAVALAEIPSLANVIVVSRADAPSPFAAFVVNQTIVSVSWEELRLIPEETAAIALARGITDPGIIESLNQASSGWVAGVTLMLERVVKGDDIEVIKRAEGVETVFDYFAGLFFDNSSGEAREVWMKTAFLPRISAALAEMVTGNPQAIRHIEALHRRHLFTDRRVGEGVTYQFHALFRAFLLSRASQAYPERECRELAGRAARSLGAMGQEEQEEEAFALFSRAEDWHSAEGLLIRIAPNLVAQGRWQTLEEHIGSLPDSHVAANPWIRYWLGRSKTLIDSRAARPILESAFQEFVLLADEIGQLLCVTTILEGLFFEFDDLRRMDPWIDRAVSLLKKGVRPFSKEDELRAHSVVMMGASYRSPRHSMLEECRRRVVDLLSEPFDANVKVAAASMLQGYSNITMDIEAERIATRVARPLLTLPQLSVPRAFFYLYSEGYSNYIYGRYPQALACFDAADSMADESVSSYFESNMGQRPFTRGLCERRAGLLDRAEATCRQIEQSIMPAKGHYLGGYKLLKASVLFDRGHLDQAVENILESYRAYDDSGHFNGMVLVGSVAANMSISAGRFDVAATVLARLRNEDYGAVADNYLAAIVLNEAWLAHRKGHAASRDRLMEDALVRARNEGAKVRFRWYVNALAELLPIAMAGGVEKDVAVGLAQEFGVLPRPADIENWPWPAKIYCMGNFRLLIDGEIPAYSRKLPRKVLALLKAIIAYGGSDVSERKVMDALWPDEEGDSAHRSLTATLHRLRKLLGNARAVHQVGGMLTLDTEYCWIDALAFENRINGGAGNPDGLEKAINLYRGAFLSQEEDAPWAVPMRERLRAKFIQEIGSYAMLLEFSGCHEQAIALYLRGIDADHLVENFYQGLMRCYDKLGRRTEAVSTYRRLRQSLSITLGVPPSAESQRLFASMRTG